MGIIEPYIVPRDHSLSQERVNKSIQPRFLLYVLTSSFLYILEGDQRHDLSIVFQLASLHILLIGLDDVLVRDRVLRGKNQVGLGCVGNIQKRQREVVEADRAVA
jgi:hypothetical protein